MSARERSLVQDTTLKKTATQFASPALGLDKVDITVDSRAIVVKGASINGQFTRRIPRIDTTLDTSISNQSISAAFFAKACRFIVGPTDDDNPQPVAIESGDRFTLTNLSDGSKAIIGSHESQPETSIQLEHSGFFHDLRRVAVAAHKDPDHELNAIFLRTRQGKLQIMATDTHRFSQVTLEIDNLQDYQSVVSRPLLQRAELFIAGSSRQGKDLYLTLENDRLSLFSRMSSVEAQIPQAKAGLYNDIWNSLDQMHEYIDKVSPIVITRLDELRSQFRMFRRGATVALSSVIHKGENYLEVMQELPTVHGKGPFREHFNHTLITRVPASGTFDGTLHLNRQFMQDVLNTTPKGMTCLEMQVSNNLHPVVFTYPDDDRYVHIMMPIRP